MTEPVDGSPVPGDRAVLRVPVPPKDFAPDSWKPTHQEFEPSGEDKKYAAQQGLPIRVSVWDSSLTTVAEARGFRGRPVLVLSGAVDAILSAGAAAVVYDKLAPPDSDRPGAAGHAGIEGLERAKGEQKTIWRDRLQRIADCFELLSAP
jgi:hypothetical protein